MCRCERDKYFSLTPIETPKQAEDEEISNPPTQPFYVPQNGCTEAINLHAGDILVTSNGGYVVVEKIQHYILETPVTVYNFEVEDFHTYYASANIDSTDTSVLVHNDCGTQHAAMRYVKRSVTFSISEAPSSVEQVKMVGENGRLRLQSWKFAKISLFVMTLVVICSKCSNNGTPLKCESD